MTKLLSRSEDNPFYFEFWPWNVAVETLFLEILWNVWNFAGVKHLTDKLHVWIKCQAQWFLISLFAFNLMMRILKSQCLQWNLIEISQVKSSLNITSKSSLTWSRPNISGDSGSSLILGTFGIVTYKCQFTQWCDQIPLEFLLLWSMNNPGNCLQNVLQKKAFFAFCRVRLQKK